MFHIAALVIYMLEEMAPVTVSVKLAKKVPVD